jgi:hypothetical protein
MNEAINKELSQIKIMIAETVAKREALKLEMADSYTKFPDKKFSKLKDLIIIDGVLSELDSNYKRLWDLNNINKEISA